MTLFELIASVGVGSIIIGLIYIGRKLQTLDDLHLTTTRIKRNLKVVSDYLTSANADFNHTELQSYSPLTLTAKGEELIEQIGFDEVFANHRSDFFACIDKEDPRLKYDVERAAISSIAALYDQEYMRSLKVFFYNNPDRNLKNVAPTLGIYIRDKYLQEHPQITE